MSTDPLVKHRLALSMIDAELSGKFAERVLVQLRNCDWVQFCDFLIWHKLAPLWCYLIKNGEVSHDVVPASNDILKRTRILCAAIYIEQNAVLAELDRILGLGRIKYVVIKGAYVRERVYPDPSLRPASDIDILISARQREFAVRALMQAGYVSYEHQENQSHEAMFTKGRVNIDLHWDILGPGRTRYCVVDHLLSRRQRIGNFWGLDDSDSIFLSLVHPAFTKYITSPNAALVNVVDFMLCLQRYPVDWNLVASQLEDTGLKTAAWSVLTWFQMVAPEGSIQVQKSFVERISPEYWRALYLSCWLKRNLATHWLRHPFIIQIGLTLFLHDRLRDAARAILRRMARQFG